MKVKRTRRGATLYCSKQDLAGIKAALHGITAVWVRQVEVFDHLKEGHCISEHEALVRDWMLRLIAHNRSLLAALD